VTKMREAVSRVRVGSRSSARSMEFNSLIIPVPNVTLYLRYGVHQRKEFVPRS
jgi:hypothetical protein